MEQYAPLKNELKMTNFWDIEPCTLISLMMEAGRTLKRRSTSVTLHGAISQKALIFMLFAVRT
jgi:hypothetical protein